MEITRLFLLGLCCLFIAFLSTDRREKFVWTMFSFAVMLIDWIDQTQF
jgi:hypothetical protein